MTTRAVTITAFVLAMGLWACASHGTAPPPRAQVDPRAPTEEAMRNYKDCLFESADRRADGVAQPADIADAALAECAVWYTRLRYASSDWFASQVSRYGEFDARRSSDESIAQLRDDFRRAIISRVLTARDTR